MYKLTKRLFDILSSSIALIILSPLLLPIIILLRLTSEGEVFYFQERIGMHNKPFKIFKFATMLKNSSKMKGGFITVKNDPRLTFMGAFLRKSKINELPQLLNIFLGHMSVVGPRPVMRVSFESYPEKIQKVIYNVKPGLTGIGSIIFRDEERYLQDSENPIDFYDEHIIPYKSDLEVWFVDNYSFYLYIKIILITAWVVLFSKSHKAHRFLGNLPIKPVIFNK